MLNLEKSKLVENDKLSEDQRMFRDILINRIEASYYNRIIKVTDPYEMFMKLKEYKQMEARTNSVLAKKEIYNLKFKSERETLIEFITKFEEKIQTYDNIHNV